MSNATANPAFAMTQRRSLAGWVSVLSGIAPDRCVAALDEIERWALPNVSAELLADNIDAAVAATLLVEGIDRLDEQGVPRKRLLKKLRTQDLWSTWAEIRVADVLVRSHDEPLGVELEPDRASGAHADWRFQFPGAADSISVDVKAVGLSDNEVAFCQRMAPALPRLLPRIGLIHGHATIDSPPPAAPGRTRRAGQNVSRRAARTAPRYPTGLRGAIIVGQDSEDSYRQRIARKVRGAVRQLPARDECWVALYWSNGAPLRDAASAIDWSAIPPHVAGVLFIGQGIAFPHCEIHCFAVGIPREHDASTAVVVQSLEGEAMQQVAEFVVARFERSAGVRATLLRVGRRDLILRDGSRRILPFNLLMDPDPDFDGAAGFVGRTA